MSTRRLRLLAILAGVAMVAAAEGALRLAGYRYDGQEAVFRFVGFDPAREPGHLVPDRLLFWRLKPGGSDPAMPPPEMPTNAAGFRGPLVEGPRRAGIPRIACLGDSVTYGAFVPSSGSYVALVGSYLAETSGPKVEMLNAGCPGYSSYQGLKLLESRIFALQPDVVTLLFGAWNDYTPAIGGDDEAKGIRSRVPAWADALVSTFGRLRLFMALSQGRDAVVGARTDARFGRRRMDEYMIGFDRGRPPEGERVPPEKFRANLTAAVRACRSRGIVPVLITPPLDAASRRKYPVSAFYREIVHEVAAAEQVKLVQAAEHLAGWEERGTAVFADWVHPNALGHEIMARVTAPVIAEALQERAKGRAP